MFVSAVTVVIVTIAIKLKFDFFVTVRTYDSVIIVNHIKINHNVFTAVRTLNFKIIISVTVVIIVIIIVDIIIVVIVIIIVILIVTVQIVGNFKYAIIKLVNEQMWPKTDADVPSFKAGDTITVSYKIIEGNKERVQSFRGVVIQIKGSGKTKMFTIRKISNGVGVERIFPLYSPHIESIEVNKQGVVRRARIYYLRNLTGKKARIKEKRAASTK